MLVWPMPDSVRFDALHAMQWVTSRPCKTLTLSWWTRLDFASNVKQVSLYHRCVNARCRPSWSRSGVNCRTDFPVSQVCAPSSDALLLKFCQYCILLNGLAFCILCQRGFQYVHVSWDRFTMNRSATKNQDRRAFVHTDDNTSCCIIFLLSSACVSIPGKRFFVRNFILTTNMSLLRFVVFCRLRLAVK